MSVLINLKHRSNTVFFSISSSAIGKQRVALPGLRNYFKMLILYSTDSVILYISVNIGFNSVYTKGIYKSYGSVLKTYASWRIYFADIVKTRSDRPLLF